MRYTFILFSYSILKIFKYMYMVQLSSTGEGHEHRHHEIDMDFLRNAFDMYFLRNVPGLTDILQTNIYMNGSPI